MDWFRCSSRHANREIGLLRVLALGIKGHGKKLYMFYMAFPIAGPVSKLALYCVEILIKI